VTLAEILRRQASRARLARLLLATSVTLSGLVGLAAAGLLMSLGQVQRGVPASARIPMAMAKAQQVLGVGQAFVAILTGIAFLMWLHGSYRALALTGSRTTDVTPGWAVGYWFIPFLNCVRPYQVVRRLWQRSQCGNALVDVAAEPAPPLLGAWWATYLLSSFFSVIAISQSLGAKDILSVKVAAATVAIAHGLLVVAGVCAMRIVESIDAMQQRFAAPEPPSIPEAVPAEEPIPPPDARP
jgi:hypothetical protein